MGGEKKKKRNRTILEVRLLGKINLTWHINLRSRRGEEKRDFRDTLTLEKKNQEETEQTYARMKENTSVSINVYTTTLLNASVLNGFGIDTLPISIWGYLSVSPFGILMS